MDFTYKESHRMDHLEHCRNNKSNENNEFNHPNGISFIFFKLSCISKYITMKTVQINILSFIFYSTFKEVITR